MVSSAFAQQAQYQADMLNLSDIRVSYVRHPISDAAPAEMMSKAAESFEPAANAITTNVANKVPEWVVDGPVGCST